MDTEYIVDCTGLPRAAQIEEIFYRTYTAVEEATERNTPCVVCAFKAAPGVVLQVREMRQNIAVFYLAA